MENKILVIVLLACAFYDGPQANANSKIGKNGELIISKEQLEKIKKRDQEIIFYGRVVSDENAPLSGANIAFRYSHFSTIGLWGTSNSPIFTTSDAKGFFEVNGIIGYDLGLENIKLDGYEFMSMYAGNKMSFNYRRNDPTAFTPDKSKPITYNIRKMGPKSFVYRNDRTLHFASAVGEQRAFYYSVFENAKLIDETMIGEIPYDVAIQINYRDKSKCAIVFKVKSENDAVLLMDYPYMRSKDKVVDKSVELLADMKGNHQVSLYRYLILKTRTPQFFSRVKMTITIDEKSCRFTLESHINPYGEMALEPDHDIPGEFRMDLRTDAKNSMSEGKHADKSLYLKAKEAKKKAK